MNLRGNNQHEQRISTEIAVDAHTEEECAMARDCHLEDKLSLPFEARVRLAVDASPLRCGEQVTVLRLAHDQLCRVSIFVHAIHNQREIVVPLVQLVPVSTDHDTRLAVADWHYWHEHGYNF
jgi:hypothetical protein